MKQITPPGFLAPGATDGVVDGRSARWDEHREQRRDVLVMAARRAIHHRGPAVSMEEIAVEAGTSKSVYYRYFGDKDGLRRAVGDDVVLQLSAAVLHAGRTAPGPAQALRAMILTYLSQAESSPNTYAFVMAPGETGADDAVRHVRDTLVGLLRGLLTEAVPAAAQDRHLALWPTAALGFIREAGEAWLATSSGARPDANELATSVAAWLLRGPLPTHEPARAATPAPAQREETP